VRWTAVMVVTFRRAGRVHDRDSVKPRRMSRGFARAARLLVEVGDITRIAEVGYFASWTGTAPSTAGARLTPIGG
jgi:hypothetical protein